MGHLSSLVIKTLLADRAKFATALAGVVFSIVLVTIQVGLYLGLVRKAGLLVDYGEADIWIGHKKMHSVDFPRDIPRRWLARVRSLPEVEHAVAYSIGPADITLPDGGYEGVFVIGVDRLTLMGNAWSFIAGAPDAIRQVDGVIVDASDDDKLATPHLGEVREINGLRARIVAKSDGIAGFAVAPYVFTTFDRAARYLNKPVDRCSYILVRAVRGTDVEALRRAIAARLPDADVHLRDTYSGISVRFWTTRTGMGISFGAATLLGLTIGVVMVVQTMYAMVLDRLGEFATLRALGASRFQMYSVLLIQAAVLALLGSVLGLVTVSFIQWVGSSPRAPIVVPAWLSQGSCVLVGTICLAASLLPWLRVRRVDPLMVLNG